MNKRECTAWHETISYALVQCGRAHRSRANALLGSLCQPLHAGQEMIFDVLRDGEWLPQNRLAELLSVEPPTVTKMLQRMEREGLVQRRPDPADARVMLVALSEHGGQLRAAVEAAWAELEAETVAGLTAEERLLLRRLLLTVRANVE